MMSNEKIKKPCPFCGKSDIDFMEKYHLHDRYYPSYIKCDVCGYVIYGKDVAWWNTRAEQKGK